MNLCGGRRSAISKSRAPIKDLKTLLAWEGLAIGNWSEEAVNAEVTPILLECLNNLSWTKP
jgi:hypothetical protein